MVVGWRWHYARRYAVDFLGSLGLSELASDVTMSLLHPPMTVGMGDQCQVICEVEIFKCSKECPSDASG